MMRTTLNLLPPEKKKELRTAVIMTFIQSMAIIAFLTAFAASVTLMEVAHWLKKEEAELHASSMLSGSDHQDIAKDIRSINAYLGRLQSRAVQPLPLSTVLSGTAAAMPAGITLTSLSLAKDQVMIEGIAAHRDDVLTAKTALERLPFIAAVDSPLSNILQRTNVDFSFTVTLERDGASL